jgi:hypothetical protein
MDVPDWRKANKGRKLERHGMRQRPEYQAWLQMKGRCYNPRDRGFRYGGALGIAVAPPWRDSFAAFFRDLGPRPAGTVLARRDHDGDFCPGNCFWATRKEQGQHRRNNRRFTYLGETRTLAGWAEASGVKYPTLRTRLLVAKMDIGRALGWA